MNDDWMEKIKRISDAHQEQVPDRIWNTVKEHLPQKKTRRLLPWFFWTASSVVGFLLLAYSINGNLEFDNTGDLHMNPIASTQNIAAPTSEHSITDERMISSETSLVSASRNSAVSEARDKVHVKINKSQKLIHQSDIVQSVSKIVDPKVSSENSDVSNLENPEISERASISAAQTLEIKSPLSNAFISSSIKRDHGIDCYSFSSRRKPFLGVEVYAGPAYYPRQLSGETVEDNIYIKRRNETESSELSFLAGARMGLYFRKVSIKLGLEYQQIYEQFNYRNLNDYRIVTIYDTNHVEIGRDTFPGQRTIRNHNYHRLINIPLSLAYHHRIGRSQLSVEPGIAVNVWSRHQGVIYNSQIKPIALNSPNDQGTVIFKNRVGFSASLNFQWLTPLTSRVDIFAAPGLQYYFSPFNTGTYSLDQNYWSLQLKLGMRYKFLW